MKPLIAVVIAAAPSDDARRLRPTQLEGSP